jgi:hypothetical protein
MGDDNAENLSAIATTRNHRDHLEEYLLRVEKEHLRWYERWQNIHYWIWIGLEAVSILTPAAATITAAVAMANKQFDEPITKTLLTTLPVISTVASSLLARTGAREMERTREEGRQQIEYLLERARLDLHNAATDEEVATIRRNVIADIERIDVDQHRKQHKVSDAVRKEHGH